MNLLWDMALMLLGTAMLCAIWRAARGPTAADRAIAAEALFVTAVSVILVLSRRLAEPLLLDVALVAVLVGFLATIGLSHFVDRSGTQDAAPGDDGT